MGGLYPWVGFVPFARGRARDHEPHRADRQPHPHYCDLAKIVGPRGSMEGRLDSSHTFAIIREGGELRRRSSI